MPIDQTSVLIVGGGIAGLTLAHILAKSGMVVDLIEQKSRLHTSQAGILLNQETLSVYKELGLYKEVTQEGNPLTQVEVRSISDRTITHFKLDSSLPSHQHPVALSRQVFYNILVAHLSVRQVLLNTSIKSIQQDVDQVDVIFSTGEKRIYSLVVGADGAQSPVRSLVFGSRRALFSGYYGWQWMTRSDNSESAQQVTEYWGQGNRLGKVPLAKGEAYIYGFFKGPRRLDYPPHAWPALLKEQFSDFPPRIQALVNQVSLPGQVHLTPMMQVNMARWYKGRVVLIGDSAHALTPNLGQGAALAISDAAALAKHLLFASSFDRAVALYNNEQIFRVQRVQAFSKLSGLVAQIDNPFFARIRNTILRWAPSRMVAYLAQKAFL